MPFAAVSSKSLSNLLPTLFSRLFEGGQVCPAQRGIDETRFADILGNKTGRNWSKLHMGRSMKSIVVVALLAAIMAPLVAICIDHDHCCSELTCTDFLNCCRGCQIVSTAPHEIVSASVPLQIQGQLVAETSLAHASGDLSGVDHPPRLSA